MTMTSSFGDIRFPVRATLLASVLLVCAAPAASRAEDPQYRAEIKLPALNEVDSDKAPKDSRKPKLDWDTGAGKSYLIPALEIVGFDVLLNQFNRHYVDEQTYGSNLNSIQDNLHGPWVFDTDPFSTNQFLHPYQGSMTMGSHVRRD